MSAPCASAVSEISDPAAELIQSIRSHRLRSEVFERQRYDVQDEPGRARLDERIAFHQLQIAILLRRVSETTRGRVVRGHR